MFVVVRGPGGRQRSILSHHNFEFSNEINPSMETDDKKYLVTSFIGVVVEKVRPLSPPC